MGKISLNPDWNVYLHTIFELNTMKDVHGFGQSVQPVGIQSMLLNPEQVENQKKGKILLQFLSFEKSNLISKWRHSSLLKRWLAGHILLLFHQFFNEPSKYQTKNAGNLYKVTCSVNFPVFNFSQKFLTNIYEFTIILPFILNWIYFYLTTLFPYFK